MQQRTHGQDIRLTRHTPILQKKTDMTIILTVHVSCQEPDTSKCTEGGLDGCRISYYALISKVRKYRTRRWCFEQGEDTCVHNSSEP